MPHTLDSTKPAHGQSAALPRTFFRRRRSSCGDPLARSSPLPRSFSRCSGIAGPAHAQTPPRGAPIKLGLIDIYSGGFTFIADTIRTGFQIAIDEANQAGGVGGRSFALVTADMGGSVEKAVTEARRMILDEQIKYVTIGIHSGAAVAAGGLAKQHKVLVVGGFATTKRLTGEAGHPYVGRANLSTVEIGRIMAEHLRARPEIKRIAVIAPDYEFGQHFAADFLAALKTVRPDIQVVRQEWPKLGATDFAPARHRAAGPAGRHGGGRGLRRRSRELPEVGGGLRPVR